MTKRFPALQFAMHSCLIVFGQLNGEIEKRNYDEVTVLSKDVIKNEEKINYHGKRAGAIVKGMLQHSVFFNLYNNAFYVLVEKKKQQPDFELVISVSTKKADGKIEIRIKDNGNGIPQKVLNKIFQPFFTTTPTGQGTGPGLSLSYDIVKAHGAEIKVST